MIEDFGDEREEMMELNDEEDGAWDSVYQQLQEFEDAPNFNMEPIRVMGKSKAEIDYDELNFVPEFKFDKVKIKKAQN